MVEQTLRVLLADAEATSREQLAAFLRKDYSFVVETSADNAQAWEHVVCCERPYHVALINDWLPATAGEEPRPLGIDLMTRIKAHNPQTEVIIITGKGMERALDALRAGAFRYLTQPFNRDDLAALIRHAVGSHELRDTRLLRAVLQVSTTVSSSFNLDYILNVACKAAVELLGVNHSALAILTPDRESAIIRAEFPAMGTLEGGVIPMRGVQAAEQLTEGQNPIVVFDVANEVSLGPIRELLMSRDIHSVLIAPVVSKGLVLGFFSLSMIGYTRNFTQEEIELCNIFAAQVAVAIENARLFEETKQRAEQLETLRRTTLEVTSSQDHDSLLRRIIQQATELLKAQSGGIYRYYPERSELTVIADYQRPDHVGKTLKVGEGMAGRLVCSDEPYMIIDDYNNWAERSFLYNDQRPFGAVLEVKLKWQDEVIGVLYVDDKVERKFTKEEAQLLSLFADQATIALVNMNLHSVTERRRKLLATLDEATLCIRAEKETPKLLQAIIDCAVGLVDGMAGWLYVNHPHSQALELQITCKLPDEFIGSQLSYVKTLAGCVVQSKQTKIAYDYSNSPNC